MKEHIENLTLHEPDNRLNDEYKQEPDFTFVVPAEPNFIVEELPSAVPIINSTIADDVEVLKSMSKPILPQKAPTPASIITQSPVTVKESEATASASSPQVISKPISATSPAPSSTTSSRHYGFTVISAREKMEQKKKEDEKRRQ